MDEALVIANGQHLLLKVQLGIPKLSLLKMVLMLLWEKPLIVNMFRLT